MATVLGIDPGLDTGYAVITDGKLTQARLGDPRQLAAPRLIKVVIECPRIYPRGTPNPNDLLKLALLVGEYKEFFASRGGDVVLVAPSDWKGQLTKEVTARRVRERFPDVDRFLVNIAAGKRHNVLDAVGIAIWGAR